MSNLEELVPPLELCRKIPKGAFADSVLVYAVTKHSLNYCFGDRRCFINDYRELIPAPTLQEIMAALARMELCPGLNVILPANGKVIYTMHAGAYIFSQGDNPSAAALKLWLDVNKLDRTDKTNKTDREE